MIVIEGLAMPKGEDDGILIAIYDGKAHQIGTKETFTASEVPAHGRLIDADALMKQIEHDTPLSAVFEKTMRSYLHNAPTIIQTEGGE